MYLMCLEWHTWLYCWAAQALMTSLPPAQLWDTREFGAKPVWPGSVDMCLICQTKRVFCACVAYTVHACCVCVCEPVCVCVWAHAAAELALCQQHSVTGKAADTERCEIKPSRKRKEGREDVLAEIKRTEPRATRKGKGWQNSGKSQRRGWREAGWWEWGETERQNKRDGEERARVLSGTAELSDLVCYQQELSGARAVITGAQFRH